MSKLNRFFAMFMVLLLLFSFSPIRGYASEIKDLSEKVQIAEYNLYSGNKPDDKRAVIKNGEAVNPPRTLSVGDSLYISFKWIIPEDGINGAAAGSYFDFKLLNPEFLSPSMNLQGDVLDPNDNNASIGTYEINDQGMLRITLNEKGVSSKIDEGTFSANFGIKKAVDEYNIYVEKEKTISIKFKALSKNSLLGPHKGDTSQFKKSGSRYRDNATGKEGIAWRVVANNDQLGKLFSGEEIETRENLIIEDKIIKPLVLDKTYFMVTTDVMVPYIDTKNGNKMTTPPVLGNGSLKPSTLSISQLGRVEPNSGESYEDFKARVKGMKLNTPTLAIYDNPDDEHSAAILFVWGDAPGTMKNDGSGPIIYEDSFKNVGGLDAYVQKALNGELTRRDITEEQAEFIRENYKKDGKISKPVGFNILFRTSAEVTSEYTNEATMYWGENESIKVETEQQFMAAGATGQVSPVTVKVKKVWADGNENHPNDKVVVKLLKNGESTGKKITLSTNTTLEGTFEDLFKFSNGKEIEYTVQEESVPNGYEAVITKNDKNDFIITNSKKGETVNLTVIKRWQNNAGDPDTSEHDPIIANVYKDGVEVAELKLENDNSWTQTIAVQKSDLDKYTVKEIDVVGYESVVTRSDDKLIFTIQNKKQAVLPEKQTITVEKVWGENGGNKILHDEITVKVLKEGEETGLALDLNEANSWTKTFDVLKSEVSKYSLVEEEVPGYQYNVEWIAAENKFLITNTKVETINIKVSKVWDENGGSTTDHEAIKVMLLKNGKVVKNKPEIVLDATSNWKGEFTSLVKKDESDNEIVYTIREEEVDGYSFTVSGNMEEGFVITNKKKKAISGGDVEVPSEKTDDNKDKTTDDKKDTKEETSTDTTDDKKDTKEEASTDDKGDVKEEPSNDAGENTKENPEPSEDSSTVEEPDGIVGGDVLTVKINKVPDPNDPNTPDTIIVLDDKGVPLGKYTKKLIDGEYEWINEEGSPLGTLHVAKTADGFPVFPLLLVFMLSLGALVALTWKENDQF